MDSVSLYRSLLDRRVCAKAASGAICIGICRSIDGYLNTVLEDAIFYSGDESKKLKSCFIKGSGLIHIEILE